MKRLLFCLALASCSENPTAGADAEGCPEGAACYYVGWRCLDCTSIYDFIPLAQANTVHLASGTADYWVTGFIDAEGMPGREHRFTDNGDPSGDCYDLTPSWDLGPGDPDPDDFVYSICGVGTPTLTGRAVSGSYGREWSLCTKPSPLANLEDSICN